MLDDVFSGLDSISEDRIFSRLLGKNGLLRQLGTTVILVTHAAHRLSHADHIIALSPRGTISEQGRFEQLLKNNGYVAGLRLRPAAEDKEGKLLETAAFKTPVDDTARENAVADLYRPVGNWAVYNYYFTSSGWRNVIIWLSTMVLYSLLQKFPGKRVPNPDLYCTNVPRPLDQVLDKRNSSSW
jgi:ATP-binding cassette subfamily C (CFTR/MRP) protein 1